MKYQSKSNIWYEHMKGTQVDTLPFIVARMRTHARIHTYIQIDTCT
jgi:hypothetical protein